MPEKNFDSTELPALKTHSHCVLLPRDPNFIYAYWDYTQQELNDAKKKFGLKSGNVQLILRLYDITHIEFNGSNANRSTDLDVGFANKNCYIQVEKDNSDYCAELGLSGGEDRFIPLMSSNSTHTPPKSISKRNDLIWQDINDRQVSLPFIQEELQDSSKNGSNQINFHMFQANLPKKARVYYLTAQDIRDYYLELFAKMSQKGKRKVGSASIKEFLKGKLKSVTWQKVRPILTYPVLCTHPGSSGGFLEDQGASEKLFNAGASEDRLNKRKFFFEVWTELIVHGRTEPDATVCLNQMGVKLNPDGTFSLRYALVDGGIPLKFIAQSSDAVEQRHLYTHVEREKTVGLTKIAEAADG